MGRITYIESGSDDREVTFVDGDSVMTAAVNGNVAGIEGECGGELSCGTCHVYLGEPWASQVPPPSPEEEEMLEVVEDQRPDSRLGCQVELTESLDGIVVTVAEATL